MQQGLLNLKYHNQLSINNFIVGECNSLAVQALSNVATFPNDAAQLAQFFCVYGDTGCGKSHLLNAMHQHYLDANLESHYVDVKHAPPNLGLNFDKKLPKIIIIDNADLFVNWQWWYHLYNLSVEQKITLIISAQKNPNYWGVELADWRSRLLTFLCFSLDMPDDLTIKLVVEKIWFDHGIVVEPEVTSELPYFIGRNFPQIKKWANYLANLSAIKKKSLRASFVKKVVLGVTSNTDAEHYLPDVL